MRREIKSLRIGVHHANAVVWEPVYRTRLIQHRGILLRLLHRRVDGRKHRVPGEDEREQPERHRKRAQVHERGGVEPRRRVRGVPRVEGPYERTSGWS